MAIVFKPLNGIVTNNRITNYPPRIFLGGTIDMGDSIDWQEDITNKIGTRDAYIFNPRRDSWDASWEQTLDNKNFVDQVTWELDNLDNADIIVFNILGTSKSPITLMEIGLYIATGKKLFICVEDGFWRKGNVEIVCKRYNIPLYNNYDDMTSALLNYMDNEYERVAEGSY